MERFQHRKLFQSIADLKYLVNNLNKAYIFNIGIK
jgi:hypothetical protein